MSFLPPERLARVAPLGVAALWCATAAGLPEGLNLCGFRWLTGHPCPLCGMTHALTALVQGHWSEAVAWNALAPLAALLLVATPALPPGSVLEGRAFRFSVLAFACFGLFRLL